jgi:hypothetical protein
MMKFVPWSEALAVGREALAKTDWARLDAMTDEEIEANALSDPDNPPLTEEQLDELERKATEMRARLAGKDVAAE